jgi:glycoside/pentoside/hexuronide:cation symporter, GPH family
MTPMTPAQDRVPLRQKIAYGCGAFTNNLLSGALGSMSIVLNLGLGMNPATIGWIMGSSRLTDAVLDPLMGYTSDHTQTRWGRRRPYIVAGALLAALVFTLLWQVQEGKSQSFYFCYFLERTFVMAGSMTVS